MDYSPYWTILPSPIGWGQSDTYDPSYLIGSKPSMIAEQLPIDLGQALTKLAVNLGTNGSLIDWSEELKAAIDEGLATGDWSRASALITELHRELQNARIPDLDFELVNTYANDSKVIAFIRKMLALVLMEKDLVDSNIAAALTKLAAFRLSNLDNAAELWANTGLIHLHRQNDLTAAQGVLSQLQTMARNGDVIAEEHVKIFGRILDDYQRQQEITATEFVRSVATLPQASPPGTITLAQNYPNPFNPATTIRFYLHERQRVRLVIYDLAGHRVHTLIESELPPGEQTLSWDGRDQFGSAVASGIYFYELLVGNYKIERKKMALIR